MIAHDRTSAMRDQIGAPARRLMTSPGAHPGCRGHAKASSRTDRVREWARPRLRGNAPSRSLNAAGTIPRWLQR